MCYGDRKNYLTALITLDEEEIMEWAKENKKGSKSTAELSEDPEVNSMVQEVVSEKNEHLANFETIKKFRILPHDLTQEEGEVTPTLKVKRRFVTEKYKDILEGMYET